MTRASRERTGGRIPTGHHDSSADGLARSAV